MAAHTAVHSQRPKSKTSDVLNQAIGPYSMSNAARAIPGKSVKFNPQTIETSFGGTHTPGRIKSSGINDSLASRRNSDTTALNTPKNVPAMNLLNAVNGERNTFVTPVRRSTMDNIQVQSTPECFHPVQFETPVAKNKAATEMNESEEDSSSVTVAVRVRPFSQRELDDPDTRCIVSMEENATMVTPENSAVQTFAYDYSFWSFDTVSGEFADQEYVYNMLAQPMLSKAFEGYNTCLFAYGQTGSGKSYSVMGHGEEVGIIPRFSEELFCRIEANTKENVKINVEISFFEIYNEKIHDLLGSSKDKMGKRQNLKVREHPVLGPYVEGLSTYVVKSFEDVQAWLNMGNKQRATAATGMNDKSSRSHSVFTLVLTQTTTEHLLEGEEHDHSITSKINLIDLAGSERQSHAKTTGQRLKEGVSINKSLLTLGKVISLLAETSNNTASKKKKVFIPYRDSVLTWMLKESLGGNSKTAMLATISPANTHMEETLSTLRYAKQARSIINIAKVNEDPKAKLIRELRAEIDKLRGQSGLMSTDTQSLSLAEIALLREQLSMKEREMMEVTRSWQERLKRSEERMMEESMHLEKSGISLQLDNKLPSLVNLNEDPQLSEMLLYILKGGATRVGRMIDGSDHDIQLNGALIADDHCLINNVKNTVSITPLNDAPVYVNGDLISKSKTLHHGDRVILGGDHYFRFNHPTEVQNRKSNVAPIGKPKDFEFARQELLSVQNARLQAELEDARRIAQEEAKREAENQLREELEKRKKEAELELSLQKHGYEDRMAQLEKMLAQKNSEKMESEKDKQVYEDIINKLEAERTMFEQEILSNRKRLEMKAKAAQTAVEQTKKTRSKLVEELQKEKAKIQQDVQRLEQRLEARKQRKASNPAIKPTTTVNSVDTSSRTDLYKTTLLLREANKISQHLKKDTIFSREDVEGDLNGETGQTLIKVSNTKMGVSTFWTMAKFEDRLVQMREIFQGEMEGITSDEMFCDPNDTWEKDDRIGLAGSPISPKLLQSLSGHKRRVCSMTPIRSVSSSSSTSSVISHDHNTAVTSCAICGDREPVVPVISVCRDLITLAMDRFKGANPQESITDRILTTCEVLKVAVSTMLDAFNQATDTLSNKAVLVDSEVMRVNSIQISSSVELLLAHCTSWTNSFTNVRSALIKDLLAKILATVQKLGNHVVLFLQGCENDLDSVVQEGSSKVTDCLSTLCNHCGELSMASDTFLVSLHDMSDPSLEDDDDDAARIKLSVDIKQAFLSGCDNFIDKTLQGGIRTVEECESKVQALEDQCLQSKTNCEILKHVEIVTVASKILLQKCQTIQVELDNTIKEPSENRPENYHYRSYKRTQALVSHVSNLADGVSLLSQTIEPMAKSNEDISLRKICRCAEMIQKYSRKIISVSCTESQANGLIDSQSESSELSMLSDSQTEQLDIANQDIHLATDTLICMTKKLLDTGPTSPNKGKRTLPSSPEKITKTATKEFVKNQIALRNGSNGKR